MKRFTMILALLLMVAMPMMAERVTPETARKVASTFLNNNGAKTAQLTDLTRAAGYDNLYIFNAEQGFVVMAADDCVQPILGYSLTERFEAENMPDNVRWWLQGYSDEIQSAINNKMRASNETITLWKDLIEGNSKAAKANVVVAPMIQTKWNQNKYYNDLCPAVSDGQNGHAYTGCVATAMAQIMKYWNYPSTGVGSHSYTWNGQTLSANFGATTYDWANMADYYEYYFVNGTDQHAISLPEPSAEEIAAVATLMYHCGVSVDMIYGGNSTGGSAAPNAYVANALKTYFNYKNTTNFKQKSYNSTVYYTDDQWIAMLKADLDASRPVQYGGQDPNENSGHAFVCDGYNSDDYFHFNWGWAGHYNGYFSINNLDTGANSGEAGAGNGVYTRNQEAVFGIEPSSMVPAPTNLAYTLSGLNDITLTWNGVSAASSYNVYRDGNLVGNTTSTTYSETVPFGTHDYYVRCVDANSQLSLSSNTVTVTIAYQTPIVTDLTGTLSGNNANLTWTAPAWCYPETPTATLNYGTGDVYYSWTSKYYAHRHLATNLAQYAGKAVYKVSTLIQYPGTYSVYIYTKSTQNGLPDPYSLGYSKTGVSVTISNDWYEFNTDEPIILTGTDDLWVVMKQEGTGQEFPTPSFNLSEHNTNAFYAGSNSPTSLYDAQSGYNCAWFINTYLTDGTYTYNLYDGNTRLASNIANTTYTVNNIDTDAAHRFTLKTNYNGGETDASNMVGFSLGKAQLNSLTLAANDQMTVTEGSQLTVSGTLSDVNPNNLILENGAQLIHSSTGVKATVKKTITPYTTNENGWNFIASPVTESITPSTDNGLLTNNYDFYMFDQSQQLEWRNYKNNNFSSINHKTGYLYANSVNTTLTFAGTLAATTVPTPLAYDVDASLKGFNLIGNPYPCNATITNDFYIINGNAVDLAAPGRIIAPCEGVFVKATGTDQTVTFSKVNSAKSTKSTDCFDLVVTQGKANIDRARVRLGEGIGMEKYALDSDKGSKIALRQEGQDFAVAYTNGQDEMPLNFKATQNDTYMLTFEVENLELDYLHLVDNMTGNDVDLLTTPSYSFEAKTTDYSSRFKLVFNANETQDCSTDSGTFAYINDGNIIITGDGDACNASLQVVDMTGRVIVSRDAMNRVSTSGITPGVYVLRLIDGDSIKTQKIVIE